jgi:hypothetical protein
VSPRKPEHQLELDTKQWCVTNVISFNAFKSKIMSKLPPIAPGQLTVIFFPLVALHHSSCCKLPTGGSSGYCLHRSGNHPQLQRVHDGGNQSINCNGTGATAIAMAMGQRRWRSIDRLQLGNGTGALGNWGNCNSNGNGAMAMEINRPFATGQ